MLLDAVFAEEGCDGGFDGFARGVGGVFVVEMTERDGSEGWCDGEVRLDLWEVVVGVGTWALGDAHCGCGGVRQVQWMDLCRLRKGEYLEARESEWWKDANS